ncbi:2-oxoacid:acceptor oxidoreductase subunit alpha [Terricaulis sp.]|uniref:2-oxoacid:acceptor oxidoreductase subunit alpha n=1 Tax=Terricaulis sp. TaxID=2768686 RepID=UPI002AC6B052|nr:2-oxoacid:acceptor oxidoreductase subunit alpha [Terricaulis sp.]MDZ4692618.1 2-oxoacid:acceptor oxidoreductase subunit alpha [Terricaulis sp.]
MSKPIAATNDFVVKFANVNGSGSASANGLFAKVLLRMGIPVGARNIFPSNIQGLPTWYEIRVSEAGWLGRRGGVDLMAAMNPQTWDGDVKEIMPGGYLIYDSSKPLPASKFRDDITIIGAPLTELIASEFINPRERQLFKNICYVGVLAQLLGFEAEVVKQLLTEEFKGKDKLIQPNFKAFELGRAYAEQHLAPIGLRVKRTDKVGDRIFVEGNEAAALGAVYGGATFCAWYPITPSTSLAEGFQKYCTKLRTEADGTNKFAIVQAEDEIASIGMVMGAGWAGSRAFTCTSGPGISLMNEFVGFSYYAEIPAVIFDVQRGGPSTGMPTRTQQSDLLLAAYASHGDTKHPMLFPGNPTEAFEFGALAFDLADFFQTTIFVMLELDIGMQEWLTEPFKWDPTRKLNRGKVLSYEHLEQGVAFGRYRDVDGDAVPYRTYPGTHPTKGSYFTRGSSHDKDARYTERGVDYVEGMERLLRKWETMKSHVPAPIVKKAPKRTPDGVIYMGSTDPAMEEALAALEGQGIHLNAMRVRGFPFSDDVFEFIRDHEQVFVVEQNRDAQLKSLLVNEGGVHPARLVSVLHYDGTPITARFIIKDITEKLQAGQATLRENAE